MSQAAAPGAVIGIDTGGTFIDIVMLTPDGRTWFHKQLADPTDLPGSVIAGLDCLALRLELDLTQMLSATSLIAHGTTSITNAVLTRTGAPTALLTTEGLRDALEMRRGVKENVFDLRFIPPSPLVPRHRRIAVKGRVGPDGALLRPLDFTAALAELDGAVATGEISAIAICLMHAWRSPEHERALMAAVQQRWPQIDVVASHEVLPQTGFYDRVSTTVITAYGAPLMRDYLRSLEVSLTTSGFGGGLFVISSVGGLMTPGEAVRQAARTVLSGPSAAPVAAARLCAAAAIVDALVVDMGGTSFDVSMVIGGRPLHSVAGEIDRLRIAFPITDVRTIALGGGSIAWVDAGGLLRLGPRSAGANPGSACFGRGGAEPTITDANLVLGYLDPEPFSRSGLHIEIRLAESALIGALPAVGDTARAVAIGIFRLAATMMAEAVQRAALDAGLDYRSVPLVVGGGAGPIHACAIALELGCAQVIVPPGAATLCAIGALFLNPQFDAVKSLFLPLTQAAIAHMLATCADLRAKAESTAAPTSFAFAADLRYVGQSHHLSIPFEPDALEDVQPLQQEFARAHLRTRGHQLDGELIELLAIRLTAGWDMHRPEPVPGEPPAGHSAAGTRYAYDPAVDQFREFAVHDWQFLATGQIVAAPALIEMVGTTCLVTHPYRATIDAERNIVLTLE